MPGVMNGNRDDYGRGGRGGGRGDRYNDPEPYRRPPPERDDPYRQDQVDDFRYSSARVPGHEGYIDTGPRDVGIDPYRHESRDRQSGRNSLDGGSMNTIDHLATFTVGQKQGLIYPEDGVKKLRQMEMTTGIWTMRCHMVIDPRDVVIYDKQTGDEMERFPLQLIVEPTAVTNTDRRDIYNNIILFTVRADPVKGSPTEMHIFQSVARPARDVVDEIKVAQSGQSSHPVQHRPPPVDSARVRDQVEEYELAARRSAAAIDLYTSGPRPSQEFRKSVRRDDADSVISEKTDREVQLLNHCFDDIEKFVSRLQDAAESFKELQRRRLARERRDRRGPGDGMLSMRARPPAAREFIDILQKFKLAFNLLDKLKGHIHDPNSPELVHFLFTPLTLVVEASKEPRRGTPDLAAKVISPLLTSDTIDLLHKCLTSKEVDLWKSLGEAWTISRDNWKGYVPPYFPRFFDGWQPSSALMEEQHNQMRPPPDMIRVPLQHSEDRVNPYPQANSHRYGEDPYPRSDSLRYGGDPYPRTEGHRYGEGPYYREQDPRQEGRDPDYERSTYQPPHPRDSRVAPPSGELQGRRSEEVHREQYEPHPRPVSPRPRPPSPALDPQRAFLAELRAKGARAMEATHDRQGRNAKELTVNKGEIIEVMDDTRNWWKLRNAKGESGHAPFTILQELKEGSR